MTLIPEPREVRTITLTPRMDRFQTRALESRFESRVDDARLDRAIAQSRRRAALRSSLVDDLTTAFEKVRIAYDDAAHNFNKFALAGLRGVHGRRTGRIRKRLRRRIIEHEKRQRIEAQASFGGRRWRP